MCQQHAMVAPLHLQPAICLPSLPQVSTVARFGPAGALAATALLASGGHSARGSCYNRDAQHGVPTL